MKQQIDELAAQLLAKTPTALLMLLDQRDAATMAALRAELARRMEVANERT